MRPRIVVVGGGPAGLSAAAAAARLGAEVELFDEQPEPGGQLRYRVQPLIVGAGGAGERPADVANRLSAEASTAGVRIHTGAIAAGLFPERDVLVVQHGRARRFEPDAVILATGSTDLPYPFAGATLPGVFSARGLKILMHLHRVRPGRRFAIIGGDEYAEETAGDVLIAGGEVVWGGIAPASFLRADGQTGVDRLTVGQECHEVDVITVAVGRQPDFALAAMAGAPTGFAAELGGPIPILDNRLASAVPGVFVTGDAAGVGAVADLIAEGRLAGVAAAAFAGLGNEATVDQRRAEGGAGLARRNAVRASRHVLAVQPYV